jgi:hypothetical protein
MPKIRIDPNTSWSPNATRFSEERGLHRLGQAKLAPMADKEGIVGLDELERLARVARLDTDGKLTPDERKRIDAYLKERNTPIVGTPNSSAVNVRSSVKKPVDGYVSVDHKVEGKDLVLNLDISADKADKDGRTEYAKRIVLKGVTPNDREDTRGGVSVQRYGSRGENASVGYATQGGGAGYIVGIADKTKGALLVNLSAAGAIAGDAPDMRTLFSPADLAKNAAVKALAKKQGLDPKKLEVEVLETSFHSDFVDTSRGPRAGHAGLHTLLLSLELKEAGSRKKPRQVEMSTLVEGNVTKALARLSLNDLEPGVQSHWGFIFPPSVEIEDDDKKPNRHEGGVRDSGGGGGEASHVRGGGGGGGGE